MLKILYKHKTIKFNTINKKLKNLLINNTPKEDNQNLHTLNNNHTFYPKFVNLSNIKFTKNEIATLELSLIHILPVLLCFTRWYLSFEPSV